MCGFTGCWDPKGAAPDALVAMTRSLQHRGPDDQGLWQDPDSGIALGFRRLSIIDLSPEGHQPMSSHSGRYVMVFNGEIYNFQEIREELGGAWRGHSDTEVILEAVERWGLEAALRRFNGMFAIALWDRRDRVLSLVRDPLGKKPLYYGWSEGVFLFGSELKALRAHPAFRGDLDRDAMAAFLRFAYIPGPSTIYRHIRKLQPGSWISISAPEPGQYPMPKVYWDPGTAARLAISEPYTGSFQEASADLEALLQDATERRCIADVPLGAFLSGGIDSTLVVALMQKHSHTPVQTYTIGFQERGFDEAPHAQRVAQHLGTRHTELYISPTEALEVIPKLPAIYDEPFADPSEIPTYLLSHMTRKHVTVALSGDGGDELFGGYDRYPAGEMVMERFQALPAFLRQTLAWTLGHLPERGWNRTVAAALGQRYSAARFRKLGRLLAPGEAQETYRDMMSYWHDPGQIVVGASDHPSLGWDPAQLPPGLEPVHRMMLTDALTYLVDDILVKVDRASMANSLEVRNPLLDRRVFEFAWALPLAYKYSGHQGKRILKEILYRHVPREMVERQKMGFGIPLGDWLRGPLRPWAEELLAPKRLSEAGINAAPVTKAWSDLCQRSEPTQDRLWPVLILMQWLESH